MDKFTVVLIDPSGEAPPEIVFESAKQNRIVHWVQEWLKADLGLAVAVYPVGAALPADAVRSPELFSAS